jgi:hypothetical protein
MKNLKVYYTSLIFLFQTKRTTESVKQEAVQYNVNIKFFTTSLNILYFTLPDLASEVFLL